MHATKPFTATTDREVWVTALTDRRRRSSCKNKEQRVDPSADQVQSSIYSPAKCSHTSAGETFSPTQYESHKGRQWLLSTNSPWYLVPAAQMFTEYPQQGKPIHTQPLFTFVSSGKRSQGNLKKCKPSSSSCPTTRSSILRVSIFAASLWQADMLRRCCLVMETEPQKNVPDSKSNVQSRVQWVLLVDT